MRDVPNKFIIKGVDGHHVILNALVDAIIAKHRYVAVSPRSFGTRCNLKIMYCPASGFIGWLKRPWYRRRWTKLYKRYRKIWYEEELFGNELAYKLFGSS